MWKRIFTIFGILYLPLLILSLILYVTQRKEQLNYYFQLQNRETSIKKEFFINLFRTPIHNINYWSQIQYPKNFDPLDTHSVFMEPYIEIIQGITEYDQFRFVDLNGMEFFRVERKGIDSLDFGPLQDKQGRPYIREAIDLEKGQIYLSKINLNRENGIIEKPYKPVLRAVSPIFDIDNQKIGVVVINFKMERILDHLRSNIVDNNFYLVDDNLNIITSNIFENNVPFEISDSIRTLSEEHKLSKQLFKKDSTFLNNNHIWSVRAIDLNDPSEASTFGTGQPLEIITASKWSVVQELPPKFINASLKLLDFSVGIFNILAIILLMTVAYFFSKNRQQREQYFNELERKNALLYKKRNQLHKNNVQISEINNRLLIRNKQLSEFNYLVSHNLRAPVTSMSVILDMIKKEKEPKIINQLLPKLNQIGSSIIELTQDIGEYVSILDEKKIKVEELDIVVVINQVKNDFSEILLDSQDFKISVNLIAWQHILFSKLYLHSILHNLISNAIKYRGEDVLSYVHIETTFENHKKVLLVKDNGIGINLGKHGDNIFKLYKRFHRNISGKGIGLFLVKSQLEALDAEITVDSEEKQGATFKITFN